MDATGWQVLDMGTGKWLDRKDDPDVGRRGGRPGFQWDLTLVVAHHQVPDHKPTGWFGGVMAAIFRR